MQELVIRFLIGGVIVSFFSLLGGLFRPRSFAGLFGAAPSIALATLPLTIRKNGAIYAAIEGRSMLAGAVALLIYSFLVSWLLLRHKFPAAKTAACTIASWFLSAFGVWFCCLK